MRKKHDYIVYEKTWGPLWMDTRKGVAPERGVLWRPGYANGITAFPSISRARAAIRRTLAYARVRGLEWESNYIIKRIERNA